MAGQMGSKRVTQVGLRVHAVDPRRTCSSSRPQSRARRTRSSRFARRCVVAAPKAPLLDSAGKKSKDLTLEAGIFAAEVKPTSFTRQFTPSSRATAPARGRSRAAASSPAAAGSRGAEGTGDARAGAARAPHWTGGGVAFGAYEDFDVKVNKKARKAAFRAALSAHAKEDAGFRGRRGVRRAVDEAGSRPARGLGQADPGRCRRDGRGGNADRSFGTSSGCSSSPPRRSRSLPSSGHSAAGHRGRARGAREQRCRVSLHRASPARAGRLEKSYSLIEDRKYSFRVHPDAHKTQVRQASRSSST